MPFDEPWLKFRLNMLPQHLYCTLALLLSICMANQQYSQEICKCVCRGTFFCSGDLMWEPLGLDTSSCSLSFLSARWDGAPSRSLLGQADLKASLTQVGHTCNTI